MNTIGERLKMLRKIKNMNQFAFAEAIGSTRSQVASVETGYREPSDLFIHATAEFFSVRKEWLEKGEDPMFLETKGIIKTEFTRTYFKIAAELSPSMESPELFLSLLEHSDDYNRMINYLSYRFLDEKDGNVSRRMAALFSVAYPDYIVVTDKLFSSISKEYKDSVKNPAILRDGMIRSAGKAAAGSPIYDDDGSEVRVSLPEKYLDTNRYKYIEVKGDSMEPEIFSGDYVVVAIDDMPEQGGLALVHTSDGQGDDGYLVKLYRSNNGDVQLFSYNEKYPPITLPMSRIVRIEKVVSIAHAQ